MSQVVIVVDFAVGDGVAAVVSVFPPLPSGAAAPAQVHNDRAALLNFGAQIVQAAVALVGSFTGAPNYGRGASVGGNYSDSRDKTQTPPTQRVETDPMAQFSVPTDFRMIVSLSLPG